MPYVIPRSVGISIVALAMLALNGCFLEQIDANSEYAYVMKKGPPLKITKWTLAQNDERKIGHGQSALQAILNTDLARLQQGEGNNERVVLEVDEAMNGIIAIFRKALATAEKSQPPTEHFEISTAEADRLVMWMIPYYAAHAAREVEFRKLYQRLEPLMGSKYHEIWEQLLKQERQKTICRRMGD